MTDTGPGTDVDDTGGVSDTEDTEPPDPAETDEDGDGFMADVDCDDEDEDVNPDAEEVVDGVDNDCDEYVDGFFVCQDATEQWETIQQGIDEVDDGGLLVICPGTYTENLVIQGKSVSLLGRDGADATIIDGSSADAVLRVARADSAGVSGLTLQNGSNAESYGGVLVCTNATLAVSESRFTTGDALDGGVFFANNCDLDVAGSEFRGGVATESGGGVYLGESEGSFHGNIVAGNTAYEGGGVFVALGDVEIDGNNIAGNFALAEGEEEYSGRGSGGGGLFVYGDSPITNNTIETNDSTHNGGGVYILYGDGDIAGNTVSGNTCLEDGAGIYTNQSSNWISSNLVSANIATDDAGGIRIYRGTTTIEDNTFEGNQASDDGGGLKMSHSTNTLRRNDFLGNITGDAGGGLELDNDTTDVSDNYFEGNQALRGAGLHSWWNEGDINMSDLTFVENVASDCGGGLSLDNDQHTVTLEHMIFEGNQAMDGAAICVDEVPFDEDDDEETDMITYESDVEIRNSLIVGNAAGDDGGAIYVKTAKRAIIENVTGWGNTSSEGGALALKLSTVTVRSSIFSENSGSQQVLVEDSTVTWVYNDVWGSATSFSGMDDPAGTSGNIGDDPSFTDAAGGDLSLDGSSPCVDAGAPGDADPDGSRADMGAYGGAGGGW